MVSLDDADGGARCGGVPTARREDGHAHGVELREASCSIWEAPFERRRGCRSGKSQGSLLRSLIGFAAKRINERQ